jgi:excinuclease ABC subunit B
MFKLVSQFHPTGDQPQAIEKLAENLRAGLKNQVFLGVTGSGKTFSLANVIANVQLPALVISHNKVLAAQLYQEFKEFFPANAVHYFVSYYDYYQPEAYLPSTDTYIEKDAKINDLIDQLRHAATADVLSRKDVIVVASVSCIYGIGDPESYKDVSLNLALGQPLMHAELLRHLVKLQYRRNDIDPAAGEFRARGNQVEIWLPHGTEKIELALEKNKLANIERVSLPFKLRDPRTPRYALEEVRIFPAKHFVTPQPKLELALKNIEAELSEQLRQFRATGKLLEAQRLEERTNFDIEMLRESGYCPGIENYSRHLSFRKAGEPPFTLIDYFNYAYSSTKPDANSNSSYITPWLCVIDESHISVPQIRGMYEGDKKRKEILVEHGFRLASALDNRPLRFDEFEKKIPQTIYVSATPGPYEFAKIHEADNKKQGLVEQLIRPTGILDPDIEVRPLKNQLADLEKEILIRLKRKERVLVLALTKRLAEDLADYLIERKFKVHWIHSEVKTLLRPELLKDLREGKVDVMVGVNLLREGLDLPEVSLVAILDADKEGFLRNATTLIQTMGRASRHVSGKVIMYADRMTGSMQAAINEVGRRRKTQQLWNKKHGIVPKSIVKPIRPLLVGEALRAEDLIRQAEEKEVKELAKKPAGRNQLLEALEREMQRAAKDWDFERAAKIRDRITKIKEADLH